MKNKRLSVRLSDSDYDFLMNEAERLGLSLADFVRLIVHRIAFDEECREKIIHKNR